MLEWPANAPVQRTERSAARYKRLLTGYHFTISTVGIFQVPSIMDSDVAFGQYIRRIAMNSLAFHEFLLIFFFFKKYFR
jgi:hypothetical protein